MSQLVANAKAPVAKLIADEWPCLTEDDQKKIALWAVQLTMVLEWADPATLATTKEERHLLFKRKEPPANWAVFLGRFEGSHATFWHRGIGLPDTPHMIPDQCNTQITIFTLGKALFHTISSSILPTAKIRPRWDVGMPCIWPIQPSVPRPGRVITEAEVPQIVAAITDLLTRR